MKYLSVQIPKAVGNYDPLLSNIRKDLARCSLLPFLRLIQCVEKVKMNIFPRLLYLFQVCEKCHIRIDPGSWIPGFLLHIES